MCPAGRWSRRARTPQHCHAIGEANVESDSKIFPKDGPYDTKGSGSKQVKQPTCRRPYLQSDQTVFKPMKYTRGGEDRPGY